MTAATFKALKGSIKKWVKIEAGTGVDEGPENCDLCKNFRKQGDRFVYTCHGCPVSQKTGRDFCFNTPYQTWDEHQRLYHYCEVDKVHCPTCKRLAQEELAFLRSLLPKGAR